MVDRNNILSLAPLPVLPGDHDMENPLVTLFFRLHEAERLHVEEVVLHPSNLLLAHASALQVNGNTGEMGRSGIAICRGRIAIVPAEFFLNFNSAYGGVYLNLLMEAVE